MCHNRNGHKACLNRGCDQHVFCKMNGNTMNSRTVLINQMGSNDGLFFLFYQYKELKMEGLSRKTPASGGAP